jgi:hypothetical protein
MGRRSRAGTPSKNVDTLESPASLDTLENTRSTPTARANPDTLGKLETCGCRRVSVQARRVQMCA